MNNDSKTKLQDRSNEAIFVGYSPENSSFRLWDQQKRKLIISRDVKFDEDSKIQKSNQIQNNLEKQQSNENENENQLFFDFDSISEEEEKENPISEGEKQEKNIQIEEKTESEIEQSDEPEDFHINLDDHQQEETVEEEEEETSE